MLDKTPATIAQVDALIGVIGDLQRELEASRAVVEKSHKRSRAAMILSALSIALIIFAGGAIVANRQAVNSIVAVREEARRVTCVQDNIATANRRAAISESIIALAPPGKVFTEEEKARVEAYTKKVIELSPFRDCSPEGIREYYEHLPADPAVG